MHACFQNLSPLQTRRASRVNTESGASSGIGLRRAVNIALSLAVTGICVWLAYHYIDWRVIVSAYARISLAQLAGIFFLGLIPTLMRVVRLSAVIGAPVSWALFRAVSIQGAALATLPAKIGEAVLPIALSRQGKHNLAEAIGVLLLLRAYDMLMLIVLGAIAFVFLAAKLGLAQWVPVMLSGAGLTVGVMLFLPVLVKYMREMMHLYLGPSARIVRLFDQLSLSMRDLTPGRLSSLILITLLVWASLFAVFFQTGVALQATPGLTASILAGVAGSLAFALPVNGIANLGPFEAAWAAVMIPLGVTPADAIAAAVLSHIVIILCNLVLASFGGLHWSLSGSSDKLI